MDLKRYRVQRARLADTLKRNYDVQWVTVATRPTERLTRRVWWKHVNTPGHFVYRIFDTKTGKIVEP